jgi:TRAP transporter TAXI family solute receptor
MIRTMLAAGLLFAGTGAALAQSPPIQLPGTIAVTAYDVGSGGYNQVVAIGNALRQRLNVSLRALPGRNDIARQVPLRDGRAQFGYLGVASYFSQEGVYEFGASREWGPQDIRLVLLNNSDQLLTIITAKDANIRTLADLRGKRVAWVAGAPSLNGNITALMAFANLTWNDVQRVDFGGYGASMTGLINGQVDAAFASTIAGPVYQLAASPRGVHYPPVPHDDTEGWARIRARAPFFMPGIGTEGPEMSPEQPVIGATYPYPILSTYAGTDEALVYNFVRAHLAFYDDYKTAAPGNVGWALERQRIDWVMPWHPGAVRALKEAGVWKAEHDAHNEALLKRQQVLQAAWRGFVGSAPTEAEAFAAAWLKARADALKAANLPVIFEN